jgi:hypothetical protein
MPLWRDGNAAHLMTSMLHDVALGASHTVSNVTSSVPEVCPRLGWGKLLTEPDEPRRHQPANSLSGGHKRQSVYAVALACTVRDHYHSTDRLGLYFSGVALTYMHEQQCSTPRRASSTVSVRVMRGEHQNSSTELKAVEPPLMYIIIMFYYRAFHHYIWVICTTSTYLEP